MAEPDWTLLRTFLAVMREGSLSRAARRLGITQPTVGRHLAALEAELGAPLFARAPSGMVALPGALDLKPHAEAMEAAAQALVRAASGAGAAEAGAVRLTASHVIAAEALPPILADFRRAHPAIAVELAPDSRNQDLLAGEADLAVRMIRPTQAALLTRRIGAVRIGLYARRDYLERRGVPRTPADLEQHDLIGFDRNRENLRLWSSVAARAGVTLAADRFAFRSDDDLVLLALLRAGAGVGGCQAPAAARDPALVPVLPDVFQAELEIWLTMHEDLRASRRVRLLFDHLAEGLSAYVA